MRALWGRTRRCALWRAPFAGAESASKIRGGRSGRSAVSGAGGSFRVGLALVCREPVGERDPIARVRGVE